MRLERLRLRDFRCWHRLELDADAGLVAIVGPNGAGKTSLLEAVSLAVSGRSPRTSVDARLVRDGAPAAFIEARGRSHEVPVSVEIAIQPGAPKRVVLDGIAVRALDELSRRWTCLAFTPDRLALVKRAPSLRRAWLDAACARSDPGHATTAAAFQRVLAQRNALLRRIRSGETAAQSLEPWDAQLAALGAAVAEARAATCEELRLPFAEELAGLGGGNGALRFRPSVAGDAAALAEVLAETRGADIARGITTRGPHLDDIELLEDDRDLRAFASQGEQRSAVLALVLAEASALAARLGEPPILLLDDVLSELDARRRGLLLERLRRGGQVLLTTADPDDLASAPDALVDVAALAAR